ncbi:MAG TPA: hypothetical protein PLR25_00280, partial [Planctomycetaceae bacterium]|nr:hypothetical protein [Planctomycetaceae bacterium]
LNLAGTKNPVKAIFSTDYRDLALQAGRCFLCRNELLPQGANAGTNGLGSTFDGLAVLGAGGTTFRGQCAAAVRGHPVGN